MVSRQELPSLVDELCGWGSGLICLLTDRNNPHQFEQVAHELGLAYVQLSLELAKGLLDVPRSERPLQVLSKLRGISRDLPERVALGRLGILHLPELQLNALATLKTISRDRVVLAEWLGEYRDGRLVYATRDHPEFGQWDAPDIFVVSAEEEPI